MPTDSLCSIILVSPQMGENIGAAARAMLNFGLTDLRLVRPRDGWPNERAAEMSSGALQKMPAVQVFESLEEAGADLQHLYATTARQRDMVKPVFTPRAAAQDAGARIQGTQRVGFVFGAERTGLTNDELSLCSSIINVPTNPDFSSLNLGQAVLLVCHEMFQTQDNTLDKVLDFGDSPPAPQADFEHFFGRLESELEAGGFFQSKSLKPTMLRNIRNIFVRADLSEQEVNTLQGIVSVLTGKKRGNKKAAEK